MINASSTASLLLASGLLLAAGLPLAAQARIVAVDIDLPLDRIAAGRPFKPGDLHRARVIYDDTQVDPKTHRVQPLHMQHYMGNRWVPASPDPVGMPMGDAWLDLSRKPYRYHYRAAVIEQGEPVFVEFDADQRRMSIRLQSDNSVVVSAPCRMRAEAPTDLDLEALKAPVAVQRAITMHEIAVRIDQVAPGEMAKVGDIDRMRVVYDALRIDPLTRTVKLLNLQHFIMGRYNPERPNETAMPMGNAWLELGSRPYRLHYGAAVVHGKPIVIDIDERSQRLTIRAQDSPGTVLLGGQYQIDPMPITGPQAESAGTAP